MCDIGGRHRSTNSTPQGNEWAERRGTAPRSGLSSSLFRLQQITFVSWQTAKKRGGFVVVVKKTLGVLPPDWVSVIFPSSHITLHVIKLAAEKPFYLSTPFRAPERAQKPVLNIQINDSACLGFSGFFNSSSFSLKSIWAFKLVPIRFTSVRIYSRVYCKRVGKNPSSDE